MEGCGAKGPKTAEKSSTRPFIFPVLGNQESQNLEQQHRSHWRERPWRSRSWDREQGDKEPGDREPRDREPGDREQGERQPATERISGCDRSGLGERQQEKEKEPIKEQCRAGSQENGAKRTLKVLYSNARSIVNKVAHLEILINDHDPDLVLICETWCNKDISNAFLNIPGYYIDNDLRKDRTDTLRGIGGGLLVYVRDGLTVKPKEYNNDLNQFSSFEVIGENKNVSKNISLQLYLPAN